MIVETIVVKSMIAIILMIVKNTSILDCDHFLTIDEVLELECF